jgi:uncharacterized protein YeaO (DUF488 family)
MTTDIRTKRVYEEANVGDGFRVLVDRVWPRGLSKERAAADLWLKDVAPSAALRTWFGHDPSRWSEFRKRYFAELDANPDAVASLRAASGVKRLTLLFGARDEEHNQAVALRDYLFGRRR